MNEQKIKKIKAMVVKFFAIKRIDPDPYTVECWTEVLIEYDEKSLAVAFGQCVKKSGFADIADILNIVDPEDDKKAEAEDEWNKCIDCAKRSGEGLEKLSPRTRRSLKVSGGMYKLRYTDSDFTMNNMKRTFIEYYGNASERKVLELEGVSPEYIDTILGVENKIGEGNEHRQQII